MQSNQASTFGAKYNPKFTVTYNVPDRTPPGETINKIFMKVASGRFFDIKKAIIQERSSLGISDMTGRTILHYILLNQEISKSDKYDLVKQAIDMGAPIDNPDSTGVRPLHIASGQQNRKVVKLLVSKKAEVNSRDNNHLTPLHYAVLPETTTCPSPLKKDLIPNTESITPDFRTDDMFNKIFDYFKADPNVQMYISHLANIFKNRYVYSDQDDDQKTLAKIVKDTIGEKTDINASESFKQKLVDFKKSIYTKTKTEFGKTFSKLDIKEGTTNGWAPDYTGKKDKQHAVLPFPNLRYEFNTLYDSIMKGNVSTASNLLSQIGHVKKQITDAQKYITDTNNLISTFYDCYRVLNTYKKELFAINQNSATLFNALNTLFTGCYLRRDVPTPKFTSQNFVNDIVPRSTKLSQKSNPFNRDAFQINGAGPVLIGLGNILIMYADEMEKLLNNIEVIMTNITGALNQGLALNSQLGVVINFGTAQIEIINICYILLIFEPFAKHLSTIVEQFKTSLVDNNMTQTLELVSRFINDVINNHAKNRSSNLRIASHDTSTGNWQPMPNPVVGTRTKDNLDAYSYIFNNGSTDEFVIVRSEDVPVVFVDGNYIVDHVSQNVFGYLPNNSNYVQNVLRGDVTNIVNQLNKIIEAGGLGRDGKTTDSHCLSKIYLSIFDLQDKTNSLIKNHNMINGFIFSNAFNNKMIDDSYRNVQTDIFGANMLAMMKKLKQIPDTYKRFYDTITPILRKNGAYSSANAIESVINLINSYGYVLSPNNKMFIARSSAQPIPTGKTTGSNTQIDGVITTPFPSTAQILQGPTGIKQGYVRLYAGDIQQNKSDDLTSDLSIINSVFDSHVYLIKLILIMYVVQYMASLYDLANRGGVLTASDMTLYGSMKKILDQIDEMTNKNSLGVLFAIIGKMVDEIIVSTIDSMSQISASNYIQFLAKDQLIQDATLTTSLSSLLGDSINLLDKQQLITKPDDRVRLKDSSMLSSVVTSGVTGIGNTDIMKFFNRESEANTTDINTDFNRLIDFDSVEKNTDMCYQVEDDLIGDLLDAGADPNMSERTGETPLSLGVFLQNEKIVDTLLRSKAKVIFKSTDPMIPIKNIYNICYEQLLNSIRGSPIMNIEDIEKRVENHLVKKSGMTKTFSNSKLILKMVAYLFTHQLTSISNGYPNMWNRDKHNKILSMLNLNSGRQDLIPLATMDQSLIEETVSGYATFRDTMDGLINKLTKERDIFIRLDNSQKNLNIELRELSRGDAYRMAEVTQMLTELGQQITTIQGTITKTVADINTLNVAKMTNPNTVQSTLTKQSIQGSNTMFSLLGAASSRDVCNVYDVFFKKIISTGLDVSNSEYTTYIQCWSSLMARPEEEYNKDQTQMIKILMNYVSEMGIIKPDIFLDAYGPVCDIYDTVLGKYGRDYTELMPYLGKDGESYYDQNYVLKQIYCIMYHVFKHTMSINFINTIAQLLARRDRGRSEAAIMRNIYEAMKSSEFIKYCVEVVPRQVIKITCKIASGEKDPDVVLTVTDVLNKAIDRLTIGTFESVDKASVDLAKEMIVPFFVTYMEAYTAEMHLFIVKQLKMMIVQSRWLSMLKLLASKAIRETE